MHRHSALLTVVVSSLLAACATAPAPTLISTDPVDGLIAKNAASATQALRDLSEASGASRVVATTTSTRSVVPQPQRTAPGALVEQALPEPQPAPQPAYIPPQPVYNIASHRGSIAVELDTPTPVAVIPTTSGVVASGGLLSTPPVGLERLITVRWTGELEQLLSRVASECGWRLGDATGLRVAPVIISINAENRSAFDVLRDIGAIAGSAADITVSAQTKTISVRYPQR